MSVITKLSARQILDSRGNPTIEVTVYSDKNFAIASVPSGASTGTHEALELRDGGKNFNGLGVLKSVRIVEKTLSPLLKGMSVFNQAAIDTKMIQKDGTLHKEKLGANSILGVSLAVARLGANLSGQPLYKYLANSYGFKKSFQLPTPLLNVLNGGLHADSGTDIQEFFYIPKRGKFANKLELGSRAISELKHLLIKKKFSTGVGDEGGFAPQINSNEKALRLLVSALHSAKISIGKEMALGIDAAASEFYDAEREIYGLRADKKHFKPASIYRLYTRWANRYHLEIIEDGCAEDDLIGWQKLTMHLGSHVRLVGDDLFVTDSSRLQAGIIAGVANTILIKPNQVGTLTETMEAIALAKKYNYQVIISHRSGETIDDFIADLSVAVSADYIKAGSLARGERMAKYNRLLKIAEELKQ
ncbi:MAG TPA: phosphopyruvate hydratase [Candidatus Doudnabacteria bacterium]|nr:phosphopyruvate hydratase [Candidatus Doudnabacteria bacterium]